MKISILALAGTSLLLGGCFGPEGNPNGQPYANEPGGAIAVAATPVGQPTYDPSAPTASFEDMRAGGAGANQPSPTGNAPLKGVPAAPTKPTTPN
jgi:hypothetical protein